jgi:hypothetical protein
VLQTESLLPIVITMESLLPIVTESETGSLDDGHHLISPTGTPIDAHVDESEERVNEIEKNADEIEVLERALHLMSSLMIEVGDTEVTIVDEIEELRRVLMSSLIIEVGGTEVTIVTEESGSLDDGHHLISPTGTLSDAHVDENDERVNEIEVLERAG